MDLITDYIVQNRDIMVAELRAENERLRAALRKASVYLGSRLLNNDAAEQARIEVRNAVRAALSE